MAGLYKEEQRGGGRTQPLGWRVQGKGWDMPARRTLCQVETEGCLENLTENPTASVSSDMFTSTSASRLSGV